MIVGGDLQLRYPAFHSAKKQVLRPLPAGPRSKAPAGADGVAFQESAG